MRLTLLFVWWTFVVQSTAHATCQLFEHKNFAGQFMKANPNESLPRLGALNDRVSSIKVAAQCLLVAYADEEYHGVTTTFGPGDYPTLPQGWDDEISSLRCNCR